MEVWHATKDDDCDKVVLETSDELKIFGRALYKRALSAMTGREVLSDSESRLLIDNLPARDKYQVEITSPSQLRLFADAIETDLRDIASRNLRTAEAMISLLRVEATSLDQVLTFRDSLTNL